MMSSELWDDMIHTSMSNHVHSHGCSNVTNHETRHQSNHVSKLVLACVPVFSVCLNTAVLGGPVDNDDLTTAEPARTG